MRQTRADGHRVPKVLEQATTRGQGKDEARSSKDKRTGGGLLSAANCLMKHEDVGKGNINLSSQSWSRPSLH